MQQKITSHLDSTVREFLDSNFKPTPEQVGELHDHDIQNAIGAQDHFGIPHELWIRMTVAFRERESAMLATDGVAARNIETICMVFFACGYLEGKKDRHERRGS